MPALAGDRLVRAALGPRSWDMLGTLAAMSTLASGPLVPVGQGSASALASLSPVVTAPFDAEETSAAYLAITPPA